MDRSGISRLSVCFVALAAVALVVSMDQVSAQLSPAPAPGPASPAAGGYYISYGALTADNVNCPPQSGRSYYTTNCNSASGPVRPYERTCSTITRCARDEV
ncbi:protein MpRALF2 [Marchantia polymorpha subsp. ruderalis]|uniref:Uncharacterized protein n=1 Tax=Marchantia polymorpha TaxID=3197 RepID=A0A2R6X2M7_MARPO|nr:hypothetical protein MARPO_0040s0047 [Marchantia polymorpha]BBN03212.1 hypothetical protein Mp_2g21670 [Marchantia polymorpha subsp. ruderalis]|eukprot:PTQ40365.1 hypothetical protein MARPO_0040s0047 [Marchantia polymorpha]